MASSSSSSSSVPPTKLHNFDLPKDWGVVNKRTCTYNRPSRQAKAAPIAAPQPPLPVGENLLLEEALRDMRRRALMFGKVVYLRREDIIVHNPPSPTTAPDQPMNRNGDGDDDLKLCELRHSIKTQARRSAGEGSSEKIRVFKTPDEKSKLGSIVLEDPKGKGKGKMLEGPKVEGKGKEKMLEGPKVERRRKLGITIPLTKREIEEDIYSLTGSKPSRRPKKYSKDVQKDMNDKFPGELLGSITRDRYRVSGQRRR